MCLVLVPGAGTFLKPLNNHNMEPSKEFLTSMKKTVRQSVYLEVAAVVALVVGMVTLSASFIY